MGVLNSIFRRSVPAPLVSPVEDREASISPYIAAVNEQLDDYIGVHRLVTAEVQAYQARNYQGTSAQAALAEIFFDACRACGSGTPPVELLEQTQIIFNLLARDGRQKHNNTKSVALKLVRISDQLALSPAMLLVSDQTQDDPSVCGVQSLAGCFADSFWYAHTVLDSVSGTRPDSVFILDEWTIPPQARRIMEACANA